MPIKEYLAKANIQRVTIAISFILFLSRVNIMENMKITSAALNTDLYIKGLASSNKPFQQPLSQTAVTLSYQVTISPEGQNKLKQELSADQEATNTSSTKGSIENDKEKLGGSIIRQLNDNATEAAGKAEGAKENTPIDELIAQKKEQIEAVKLQLEELIDDGSEQVAEQKKALQNQITELNGQLLMLMEEKLKQAKAAK